MGVGGWLDYVKLRLAKASQLSWSWGLAWLSLAIVSHYIYMSKLLFKLNWLKQGDNIKFQLMN